MRFLTKLLCILALAALLPACGGGPTRAQVERGQALTTGTEAFDTFFREVVEVAAEADKSTGEARDAGKPLTDALGAASKGTPPAGVVRAQAKKLQMDGTLLHLDLVPEAKLVTSGKPDADTEKLLAAAEQSAKSSVTAARRSTELLTRISDLLRRYADLSDKAKSTFPEGDKRDEVSRELRASASVLEDARTKAETSAGTAARLALDLAMALETGAGSSTVAKKPPKPAGRPGTAAPARPRGDDFDR
ncbi:MAG: hypothetical protein R3F14_21215 [Polyangiaceae bacterium]